MGRVRAPVVEDAPALGAVHVRAWQRAYRGGLMPDDELDRLSVDDRTAMWRTALEQHPPSDVTRWVAEADDGEVVGFVIVGPVRGGGEVEIGEVFALNVAPDAWSSGHGRALLSAGEAALADVGFERAVLWVHPDNVRARRFYQRAGWRPEGRTRRQQVLGIEVPEIRYERDLS